MHVIKGALACLTLLAFAAPANAAEQAETVYGVIDNAGVETLVTVPTTTGAVTNVGAISGITAMTEKIVSMDFRPATGELYALTSEKELIEIDPLTGTSTPVATTPSPLVYTGDADIDFNPVPDALRLVTSDENNLRIPMATGVAVADSALTGASSAVVGAAYTNATAGAQQTTLYDVDDTQLLIQGLLGGAGTNGSPNNGVLTSIGAFGGLTTVKNNGGFDISPSSGRAIVLRGGLLNAPTLYDVNLDDGSLVAGPEVANGTFHAMAIRPAVATMSFTAASSGAVEGGNATITVRRVGNINATPTFSYTVAGVSASASDFGTAAPASPIQFAAGETTKTITIPVNQDKAAEGPETFTVTLPAGTNVGGNYGSPTVHTVTINDDDAPYAAADEKVFGLTDANGLITFSASTPGTVTAVGTITGIGTEQVVGLDIQPSTGRLFAVTDASKVYTVNKATGAATQVGSAAFTPAIDAGATSFGVDFNPVPNAIRFLASGAQNQSLRISPVTGAVAGTDTAPAGITVADAAYTNSVNGANSTTLYVLDSAADQLVRIGGAGGSPSPNGGTTTVVGQLGADISGDAGFDISGASGVAYVSVQGAPNVASFHKVDLASGAASTGVPIGGADADVIDIAVDAATPSVQFSGAAFAARENAGNAVVTVTRTGNTDGASNVTVSTGTTGTATAGTDFTAVTTQAVAFAAGETSKTVNIPLTDDTAVEENETIAVSVALAAASPGASLGAPNAATVTVFDNDPATTTVPGPVQQVPVQVPVLVTGNQVLLTAAPNQIKRSSLAKGLKLTASCAETCSLSYTLKLGSTTLGTATAKRTGAGLIAVKLNLTSKGKSALTKAFKSKKVKSKVVTLSGKATDSDGGKPASGSVKIRVLR